MRAWLDLRYTQGDRVDAFRAGLQACGYAVRDSLTFTPKPGDILVVWNRIADGDRAARQFEGHGLPVLVAENCLLGKDFAGGGWYSLARNWHNTAGMFPGGGLERWDSLGVELAPWRTEGETVVLPQRGIGPREIAMPRGWMARGRVRPHPGKRPAVPLEQDLARCGRVVTWGSGAAVKALLWGIPVESHMPRWIARQDNTDAGRLAMLRTMIWAQWRLDELATGEPFRRLLWPDGSAAR